ncbi:uncharacterized protein HMPREF1541_00856 [Cyphellophora europaea CBS 101466]|uniref:Zn(2)-C6 fungal-type domain-containing protein n=1 Tax=Cyphellophora europaea (strain CBS 101466) TaxID=1220924 RepID=W2SDG5_CYPE1|nr:uncharacterized protein HMPREF1541_00856 [Cyphellophora europaea CBS 101466]ETN46670.1 hypothetical protein HMPREF1541_00856 [Cyphellophora europaea CBS 101466]
MSGMATTVGRKAYAIYDCLHARVRSRSDKPISPLSPSQQLGFCSKHVWQQIFGLEDEMASHITPERYPPRRKLWAPKCRTGCDMCKKRRIKCDETKPVCARCLKIDVGCHYTDPIVKIVYPSRSTTREACQSASNQGPGPNAALSSVSRTQEEKLALKFFLEKTGPWMASNGPSHTLDFWTTTIPRAFHSVPGTRHLVTALGLLETSIGTTDLCVLETRCRKIHHHYSVALHELTQPDPDKVDVALGPLLAWLLETMMFNDSRADIHAEALERLSSSPAFSARSLAKTELSQHDLDALVSCVRRARKLHGRYDVQLPLLQVLQMRSQLSDRVTPADTLLAFEQFYTTFSPQDMNPDQMQAAGFFLQKQMAAVHGNVYRSEVPMSVYSALHYTCIISSILLPTPEVSSQEGSEIRGVGLDFILEACEDMLERKMATKSDQRLLDRALCLLLRVMASLAPAGWRREQAERLKRATFLIELRTMVAPREPETGGDSSICVTGTSMAVGT